MIQTRRFRKTIPVLVLTAILVLLHCDSSIATPERKRATLQVDAKHSATIKLSRQSLHVRGSHQLHEQLELEQERILEDQEQPELDNSSNGTDVSSNGNSSGVDNEETYYDSTTSNYNDGYDEPQNQGMNMASGMIAVIALVVCCPCVFALSIFFCCWEAALGLVGMAG